MGIEVGASPSCKAPSLRKGASSRAAACVFIFLLTACSNRSANIEPLLQPNSGGATTVMDATRHAYSRPAANLRTSERTEFAMGNAFFNSPWVVAPATAAARDGLDPLFNARSCDACHNNDGRGRPPEHGDRPISLVVQFGMPAKGAHGEPLGEPNYGGNLNPFSITGDGGEGTVVITYTEQPGQFADGEAYSLRVPRYEFKDLQFGPLAAEVRFSPRVAPAVFGSGLLEAVADEEILEREDPDDRDRDGTPVAQTMCGIARAGKLRSAASDGRRTSPTSHIRPRLRSTARWA
jgi:CxxC motif-containing protein (DUF1111 family)